MKVMQSIVEKGEVVRGWLGISSQDVTPELAKALLLDMATGALVSAVVPGSPAADSGFLRGDVIVDLRITTLEEASRERFGISAEIETGVLVKEVLPRSAADRAGRRPGDVVVEVNQQPVTAPAELWQALNDTSGSLLLWVARGEARAFAVLSKR